MRRRVLNYFRPSSLCATAFPRFNASAATPTGSAVPDSGKLKTGPDSNGTKLARIVGMELNRIKSEYRRNPTPQFQKHAISEVTRTPLQRIQGLDAKVVSHILATLVALDAPPGLNMTKECASWLCSNVDFLGGNSLAQSLHALKLLNYNNIAVVVDTLSVRIPPTLDDMSSTSIVMLLDSLCETRNIDTHGAQILSKVQEIVSNGAFSDAIMLAGALSRLPPNEDAVFLIQMAVTKIVNQTEASPLQSMNDVAALLPVVGKADAKTSDILDGIMFKYLEEHSATVNDAVPLLRSCTHVPFSSRVRQKITALVAAFDISSLPSEKNVQILLRTPGWLHSRLVLQPWRHP